MGVILALILLCAETLRAQAPPIPPAPPAAPANWYGAGGAWNSTAAAGTSQSGGWMAYSTVLNRKAGLRQFDLYNSYLVKPTSGGRAQIASSATVGMALSIRTLGPLSVYAFGTAGVATAGANAGNTFPYGGFVDLRIGSTLWHLDGGYMLMPSSLSAVATQKVVLFGLGRLF